MVGFPLLSSHSESFSVERGGVAALVFSVFGTGYLIVRRRTPKITAAEFALLSRVPLTDMAKVTEAHEAMPLFVPETKSQGFEAAAQRHGRHGLK